MSPLFSIPSTLTSTVRNLSKEINREVYGWGPSHGWDGFCMVWVQDKPETATLYPSLNMAREVETTKVRNLPQNLQQMALKALAFEVIDYPEY